MPRARKVAEHDRDHRSDVPPEFTPQG